MYTPLYIKTDYSLLNSMIKIDELVSLALSYGYKSLTITDSNMYGAYVFYKKCIQNDIKPIIGLEINIEKIKFVLYAKNETGYHNLVKISSGEDKLSLINKYNSDLICIIPFESIDIKNSINIEDMYISYKNIEEADKITGKKIYMNEILYLKKEDSKIYPFLEAIKEGKTIEQVEKNRGLNYLKNKDEIKNFDLNIEANYEIYDKCDIKLTHKKDLLPLYDEKKDPKVILRQMCEKRLKQIFKQIPEEYKKRLDYELDVINDLGFSNYFLIVQDYVNYAKSSGILVGPGRGSAASSLVSYLLNITQIDPLKYNLVFERFLNKDRVTMPDIDVDFEFDKRNLVVDYVKEKYGQKKVAGIITFGTLTSKQVIRDVGRSLNIDDRKIDYLSKKLNSNLTLKENYNNIKDILDENLKKVYNIALKLEGLKRHTSIHAAGIVICRYDLDLILPIVKKDDMYLTGYTMEYLEELGLLKMDFLALKTLSIIESILDLIGDKHLEIKLDDPKTMEIFKQANTFGIFQFESNGMKSFLKKLNPTNFEDIVSALALYRPGPMDNIDTFIKRKQNKEKIDYIIPELESILKPTYGIIIYQEQIMQIARKLGYTYSQADILRKAISKKNEEVLLKEKENFLKIASTSFPIEKVKKVFDFILKFASYGFNRAHSVCYANIAYKMAYLKANYPVIFAKVLLDNSTGLDLKDAIIDAKENNIKISKPSINKSEFNYLIENDTLIMPLSSIKGISYNLINEIIKQKNNSKFKDIFDFVKRITIKQDELKYLILSGAFDEFYENKNILLNNIDLILNYGELVRDLGETYTVKPILKEASNLSLKEQARIEEEVFGFYLLNHPVTVFKSKYKTVSLSDINKYFDRIIDTVIMVNSFREIKTKTGEKMCFITASDEKTICDVVAFPKIYENMKINKNDILLIRGKVEKRFDKYQIIIQRAKRLM